MLEHFIIGISYFKKKSNKIYFEKSANVDMDKNGMKTL